VVRTALPRIAPRSLWACISRSTVQRATSMPSRCCCRYTFCTIWLQIHLPNPLQVARQHLVTTGSRRAQGQIAPASHGSSIGRWGTCKTLQIGSTPKRSRGVSMKPLITCCGGRAPPARNTRWPSAESRWPSSTRVPRAQASLMRAASAVVTPSRCPVSRSYWRTPFDGVCALQPILAAINSIAAHCDPCSLRCSNTMRTARSLTSGENLVVFSLLHLLKSWSLRKTRCDPVAGVGGESETMDRRYVHLAPPELAQHSEQVAALLSDTNMAQ